jgi:hypothetical protein
MIQTEVQYHVRRSESCCVQKQMMAFMVTCAFSLAVYHLGVNASFLLRIWLVYIGNAHDATVGLDRPQTMSLNRRKA